MLGRIFRKMLRKKKSFPNKPGSNSFQEGMYSIYLSNWIKEKWDTPRAFLTICLTTAV